MDTCKHETEKNNEKDIIKRIIEENGRIPIVKLCRIDSFPASASNWMDISRDDGDIVRPSIDELIKFTTDFRMRRISLGLSQRNVTEAIHSFDHTIRKVSMLKRFESLDLGMDCAMVYYPYLCLWMDLAEAAKAKSGEEFSEFLSGTKLRQKSQKCFLPKQLHILNDAYMINPIPSENDATKLMWKIGCSKKSILDWFSNKKRLEDKKIKQKMKEIKKQEEICKILKEKETALKRKKVSPLQSKIDEMSQRTTEQEQKFSEMLLLSKKKSPPVKKVKIKDWKKSNATRMVLRKRKTKRKQQSKEKSAHTKHLSSRQPKKFEDRIKLLQKNSTMHDEEISEVLGSKFSNSSSTS